MTLLDRIDDALERHAMAMLVTSVVLATALAWLHEALWCIANVAATLAHARTMQRSAR